MKRQNKIKIVALAMSSLLMQSCLDFDVTGAEFNMTETNESKVVRQGKVDSINCSVDITEKQMGTLSKKLEIPLKTALGGIYALRGGKNGEPPVVHQYQYLTTFYQDAFAQYGVIPHVNFPYSGINIVSSSAIDLKAYGGAYGAFQTMNTTITPLLNMAEVDSLPEIKATFLLFYDFGSIECADNYGPFPYQDFKTNKQNRPFTYDDVETIYNTVEANLDSIVKCYEYYEQNRPQWYKEKIISALNDNARCYTTDAGLSSLDVFKRFANSLKLRMAMHIVKINPDRAKQWAEEAVKSGVIETEEQEIGFRQTVTGYANPMVQLWNEWNDMRMGAGMEQVLRAFNHPFLEMVFDKNGEIANKDKTKEPYKAGQTARGILSGAHVGQEQGSTSNPYNGFSKLNMKCMSNAPLYLMKLSEVCFLRAEGAVRGWDMGGSAKQFYEQGIREGDVMDRLMQLKPYRGMYKAALDNYMELEKAYPFTYVDPTGNDADRVSEITIGVKWNEGDAPEVKLEKIISQKYIAGFPNSLEAWVDLRRTGYPRLFKMLNVQDGDGSLKEGDIVRRLPFPDAADPATKKDIEATGLKALGGADQQATRLWWDIDKSNF